jgi:hypothetical protein
VAAGVLMGSGTALIIVAVVIVMRIAMIPVTRNTMGGAIIRRCVKGSMNDAHTQPRENADHGKKAGKNKHILLLVGVPGFGKGFLCTSHKSQLRSRAPKP